MPVSFSQIASNTASVTFSYGSSTVTAMYYPGRITDDMLALVDSIPTLKESSAISMVRTLNDILCEIIKEWDVYEDDKQTIMYPLDPARLGKLPLTFRVLVFNEILSDIRPNETAPTKTLNS